MTDERPPSSESHQSTTRGNKFEFNILVGVCVLLSFENYNQNYGDCFIRHDYSAPTFRDGSTSRQRGTFGRASNDQNGHIMEAHRPGYVGYSAAASRQPTSFRRSQVVAYAEF